ncbi:hypothetical protein GGR26_000588 [Lewinella marina]|uniref:Uncharacterized protein n=1 Tax=Neolewinella marina TaxID=438751 RepID=A0A2G0CJ59_9BACT|nr:hypothetical protein [Neolewinella marina]NJB84843.1 hypothetical protein [Neolewinella marina]PHL00002.1 hypothetical protein CGL56_02860 [Neolewinella marina]
MKQEKHPLDDLIRQRIANLPPGAVRGWEELERRLDMLDTADDAVADKLNTLSAPPPPPGSWSAFEQKLTAAEAETAAAIDSAVATVLSQASTPPVSGWAQLAARLELIGQRREMVMCLKISEAALLLSLLLVALRFAETTPPQSAPIADTGSKGRFPIQLPQSPAKATEALAPALPAQAVTPTPAQAPRDEPRTSPASLRPTPAVPTLDFHPESGRNQLAALPRPLAEEPVGTIPTNTYGVEQPRPKIYAPLQFGNLFSGEPVQYVLNAFVSPVDLNQVITQANPRLGIEGQSKLSTGYSIGTLLDVSQGKNAIQVGFIYGYRSYVPAEILNIEQDSLLTPQDENIRYGRLTYRTLSLPLNYVREIATNDRWRLSGGVGMAMNVILDSEFQLADNYTKEDLERVIDHFVATHQSSTDGRASSGRRNILNPEVGYLQGGSIFDNSSLYVSGTLRVERLLNDRWSLYFAPTVTRLFTVRDTDGGKGPLEDRIHNTMLRLGTRIRLTDK